MRAEDEGREPGDVVAEFHQSILDTWQGMGISFDTFTTTMTDNHREVAQGLFLALDENGHLRRASQDLFFDPQARRFLPDRYIEGECPHCGDRRRGGISATTVDAAGRG